MGIINIGNMQLINQFSISNKFMKHFRLLFPFTHCLLLIACFLSANVHAQSPARLKVAVFTPLYIDSAFQGSSYKYDKTFPKFLNPGLEFYQGVQWALDSLQKKGAPLEVFIYDSRSTKIPLAQRFTGAELKDVQMIIAHATAPDVRILATEAQRRKIPFLSATLPNDAGITNNPYMVVLNSTLRTHCEGIYQYLQKYHSQDRIILFRRNGAQEGLLRDYFNEAAKSSTANPLKIELIDIGNNFDSGILARHLDSTRKTICIAGSLDENFGNNLLLHLSSIGGSYPLTIIGMPTWDDFNFAKPEYKNIDIIYTSPFNYNRSGGLSGYINTIFEETINSRPTDMFFRGYETMLRFGLLLLDTKKDVASNLTRKGNYVFTQFDIQPVFLNKSTMTLDYFENKKLYFIRYANGIKSTVN
jgi:hypothetical protein